MFLILYSKDAVLRKYSVMLLYNVILRHRVNQDTFYHTCLFLWLTFVWLHVCCTMWSINSESANLKVQSPIDGKMVDCSFISLMFFRPSFDELDQRLSSFSLHFERLSPRAKDLESYHISPTEDPPPTTWTSTQPRHEKGTVTSLESWTERTRMINPCIQVDDIETSSLINVYYPAFPCCCLLQWI